MFSDDAGGWLWLLIDVLFVAALIAAIAYGVIMWRRRPRSRTVREVRDEATRDLYRKAEEREQRERS